MMKVSALATIIIGLSFPIYGYTQVAPGSDIQGINRSFYPLAGYSSDFGFYGGGLYQRIDYANGVRPFLTNIIIDATGSTNGLWSGTFEYERTQMFGNPLRSRYILNVERNPISTYFGIGNRSDYSSAEFEDGVFYLLQRRISARIELRRPLFVVERKGMIEGVLRLKTSYTDNDDSGADTRFVLSSPLGAGGGWVNTIGAGVIYDIRNSEFDPRSGIRAEMGADFSPVVAGNDYGFSSYFAELTSYASFMENIVFAQRIAVEHSYGSAPYFELPALGNKHGLRGFPLNRFIGESSMLYMAEVRSWLFHLFDDQVKLGGHIFYDTGRVFSEEDSNAFFDSWKRTWGAGGAMSLFSKDLILRGEIGFSDESYRIYAGFGYAF